MSNFNFFEVLLLSTFVLLQYWINFTEFRVVYALVLMSTLIYSSFRASSRQTKIVCLAMLNYTGLEIVGKSSLVICIM